MASETVRTCKSTLEVNRLPFDLRPNRSTKMLGDGWTDGPSYLMRLWWTVWRKYCACVIHLWLNALIINITLRGKINARVHHPRLARDSACKESQIVLHPTLFFLLLWASTAPGLTADGAGQHRSWRRVTTVGKVFFKGHFTDVLFKWSHRYNLYWMEYTYLFS